MAQPRLSGTGIIGGSQVTPQPSIVARQIPFTAARSAANSAAGTRLPPDSSDR